MRENVLVSVVVPCYNVESKVHRLFDSLLAQTYKNLQIIIVNDGSKDNTEEVILSYESKFKAQGYIFKYVYQENSGVAAALENGLKYVEGEFLIWPDADDYLFKDSIRKSLSFLLENEEYAFVKTDGYMYHSKDLSTPIQLISRKLPQRFKEADLMEDYILEKDVYFCPVCFMIRFSDYKSVNPDLYIYHGKKGQNYQMILPLAYAGYKFGYIDEPLCAYLIFDGSISHKGESSYYEFEKSFYDLEQIILHTLEHMNMTQTDRAYYVKLTKQKYAYKRALKAYEYGLRHEYVKNRPLVKNFYLESELKSIDFQLYIPCAFKIHFYYLKVRKSLVSIIKHNKKIYNFLKGCR